jgi:hypothetical protein
MYIVFIINKHNVIWHETNINSTISTIFRELEVNYNIKKCMLDIKEYTFVKPCKIFVKDLLDDKYGCTIYVTMKD